MFHKLYNAVVVGIREAQLMGLSYLMIWHQLKLFNLIYTIRPNEPTLIQLSYTYTYSIHHLCSLSTIYSATFSILYRWTIWFKRSSKPKRYTYIWYFQCTYFLCRVFRQIINNFRLTTAAECISSALHLMTNVVKVKMNKNKDEPQTT